MASIAPQGPPARPRRKPGQRLSPALKTAIQAKALVGESKSQTALDLGVSRNSVTSVLMSSEIEQLREAGRSSVSKMIPQSVQVYQYHLDRNDKEVATHVLKGIGVLAPDVQTNVGIFNMTGNADIAGLMGLADDLAANGARIDSESAAIDAECEPVPAQDAATTPDK